MEKLRFGLEDLGARFRLYRQFLRRKEILKTHRTIFLFPYLSDPQFLNSPQKDAIDAFDLLQRIITPALAAAADLEIKQPFSITTQIPQGNTAGVIPEIGIGARVLSQWEVRLSFSPIYPDIVKNLEIWMGPTVAHELNHIKRFQLGLKGENLLDAIVNEGLATYYQELWEGNLQTPWGHSLTPVQMHQQWSTAQSELTRPNYDYHSWFFGRTGAHPRWTGYSLGLAIVNSYINKHPKEKMVSLLAKPAATILAESGFDPASAYLP